MLEVIMFDPSAGYVDARTPREILARQLLVENTNEEIAAAVERLGRMLARIAYPKSKPVAMYVREMPPHDFQVKRADGDPDPEVDADMCEVLSRPAK